MPERYPLVISLGICTLTHWLSKYSKKQFLNIKHDSEKCEKVIESAKEPSILCHLFQENLQFFKDLK
jgi:hypothetical protein